MLGLFSFVIWALVAYQQTGIIQLNPDTQLSFVRVVLLLFANIVLLIAGLIMLNNKPWSEKTHGDNIANGVFLVVTAIVVFAPIFLSVPLAPKAAASGPTDYRVAVVYQDTSLTKIAPGKLSGRYLCDVLTVQAPNRQDAVQKALTTFKASDDATPAYPKDVRGNVVAIDENRIVAEAAR